MEPRRDTTLGRTRGAWAKGRCWRREDTEGVGDREKRGRAVCSIHAARLLVLLLPAAVVAASASAPVPPFFVYCCPIERTDEPVFQPDHAYANIAHVYTVWHEVFFGRWAVIEQRDVIGRSP